MGKKTDEERFWSKVFRPNDEPETCWFRGNIPFVVSAGCSVSPHRWAWEEINGRVPIGMKVSQTCGNPSCIRPSHLALVPSRKPRHKATQRRKSVEDRFWAKVARLNDPDACWAWTGCKNRHGVGVFWENYQRRAVPAPRMAWIIEHGMPPNGMAVAWSCQTVGCCRPDHLFLSPQK